MVLSSFDSENCSATDGEKRRYFCIKNIGDTDGSKQKTMGSRNRNGNVPSVKFNRNNDKVYVNRYNPDDHNDNLHSRSEVPH